jgi:hypothetical protein
MKYSKDEKAMQAAAEIARLYDVLSALKKDVGPGAERQFQLLAEGPLIQIRQLEEQIDSYLWEADTAFFARIDGAGLEWHNASLTVIADTFNSIQKSFQGVALKFSRLREYSKRVVKEATELRLITTQLGSLKIGLRFPERQDDEQQPDLSNVVKLYLELAEWASGVESSKKIEEILPDQIERADVLRAFGRLIPSTSHVEFIELYSSKFDMPPARITFAARKKIDAARAEALAEIAVSTDLPLRSRQPEAETSGRIREVNLDTLTLTLRQRGSLADITCSFESNLADTVRWLLDRDVLVSGVHVSLPKGSQSLLRITSITLLDDPSKALPPNK